MTIIPFEKRKPSRLTCTWVPTGNARTPLACVWKEASARKTSASAAALADTTMTRNPLPIQRSAKARFSVSTMLEPVGSDLWTKPVSPSKEHN
jgi:hypothetical protein